MPEDIDKYIPVSRTDINIDKGMYSSNLGLSDDYYVSRPYADFVLVEYIDVKEDMIQTKDGLYVPQTAKEMTWRKGKVLQVGPEARHSKVGDLVVFPNDKGLPTNKIHYLDIDGTVKACNNAIFINDERLFARMKEM